MLATDLQMAQDKKGEYICREKKKVNVVKH